MASKRPELKAEARTITGRKIKQLRRQGTLPGNIFGKKVKSQAVSVPLADFTKVYAQVGETGLVDLVLPKDKAPRSCLITNVHLNPITDIPLHVDFHQVDLTQKVTAHVPIELTGESPAVKEKGADLITVLNEIEIEALPTDLPDKFTVDISGLTEFDAAIFVKDLKVEADKVTVKVDPEEVVVKVQEHKEEKIEEPTPPPADVSAEAAAPAEGETPAEAKPEEKPAEEKTEEKS